MDRMMQRKQCGSSSKTNAHQLGAAASTSSRRNKGKGAAGGKKPPIKVVYIGNPMRVTTSEAGFRALVQELTGRHADPYKYSAGGGGATIDADADASSGGSPVEPHQAGALPSPISSTPSSDAASAAGAGQQVSVPACCYDDDDGDCFAPQLIDNSYSVFSPPTFLYGPHGELM
ncbi:hypothetical protein U9M48_044399 [Paspalum notatum var. saurae]|uniref:VQ domain-containing protein n=1 Tax=Paspalum notatum var. saurae TaxID=547442 RepID=A0AAQ3UUX0_PASNO